MCFWRGCESLCGSLISTVCREQTCTGEVLPPILCSSMLSCTLLALPLPLTGDESPALGRHADARSEALRCGPGGLRAPPPNVLMLWLVLGG